MDPMRLIIEEQIRELRREAKANRLMRVTSDNDAPRRNPSWPTRARRRLGDTLVAAGETLRSAPDEQPFNRAA